MSRTFFRLQTAAKRHRRVIGFQTAEDHGRSRRIGSRRLRKDKREERTLFDSTFAQLIPKSRDVAKHAKSLAYSRCFTLKFNFATVILAPLQLRSHYRIFKALFLFSPSLLLSASYSHSLSYTRVTACVHRCQSTRQTNAESKFIFGVAVERKTNSLPARTTKEVAGREMYIRIPFRGHNETGSFEKR